MKREERDKFIGNFAQAKNLIEKQMKLGNFIRDQKAALKANRKKVAKVNEEKSSHNHVVAIKNKLYDNPTLDTSTEQSSTMYVRMGEGANQDLSGSQIVT